MLHYANNTLERIIMGRQRCKPTPSQLLKLLQLTTSPRAGRSVMFLKRVGDLSRSPAYSRLRVRQILSSSKILADLIGNAAEWNHVYRQIENRYIQEVDKAFPKALKKRQIDRRGALRSDYDALKTLDLALPFPIFLDLAAIRRFWERDDSQDAFDDKWIQATGLISTETPVLHDAGC